MSHRDRQRRIAPDGGFTIVEACVALAILGLALLLELGSQWQSRAALQRLEVEAALLAHAEATVESVRAGLVPLSSGDVDPLRALPGGEVPPGEVLRLEVAETPVKEVCAVTVVAEAVTPGGRVHDLRLETRVWLPGAPCR